MNDADYKALVQAAYNGQIIVGVDRVFARKLYTDVAISTIEKATGEAPYVEKIVVWFAFLASPVAILSSVILAVFAFRWWALLIVPAALLIWMSNASTSARGDSSIWFLTFFLIVAVIINFINLLPIVWMSGFITVFVFALWCHRFLYYSSTFFFRAFILRNQRAFETFNESITIREAD